MLVFLHEGLGSVQQWKNFPDNLSNELKIPALIYDRFGYGKSEKIREKPMLNYLEEDAKYYMPEIFKNILKPNNKLIIIGHSDGGSLAILFAALFPKNVKAIITEAAHVFNEEITLLAVKPVLENFYKQGLKEKLEKYHGNNTISMFHNWYDVWTNPDFKNWNIENYLELIKCPVLAIQGENDEYGSMKQIEALNNKIKSMVQTKIIKNCAHTPHFQAETTTFNLMKNFITNI